jgi:crotonobetainyl-CoA:carnitine CoA-transferase CaiB-like acyl-CoA transferase
MADDPRWVTKEGRVNERRGLIDKMEASLRRRPGEKRLELLGARGIPSGPVNDIDQVFDLARRLGLDAVQTLERDDGTTVAGASNPISFARTPVSYRKPPPNHGADTDAILDWLDSR